VDFDNLILKVFGKVQKEKLVPFSSELRKRLYRFEQLKTKKGILGDYVFVGSRGSRWEKRDSSTSLYLMQRKLRLPLFG
jgi:site-specific recombinase XerC